MTGQRVLYVQYTNPAAYPPVEHSAWILAETGFDVLLLGTSIIGDALTLRRHPRIRVALMPYKKGGWRQKAHYAWFGLWVLAHAIRWRPTWVYASDPLSAPVALVLGRLLGVGLIYHEHDSPSPDEASGAAGSAFMKIVMRCRRAVAARSHVCILPNEQRAQGLRTLTGQPNVLTIWNCPLRDETADAREDVPGERLRVLYHGSIVPARLPPTVLEALALLPAHVSLVVAGYETAGSQGYVGELSRLAERLGIAERVRFAGILSRGDLMRHCATCDVGLALMRTESTDLNERTMVGASNKPFDYLACGLPLLVTNLPDWQGTYVEAGLARSCDPNAAESIAAQLRWFADHRSERLAMGEQGRQRILADWNYEVQFAPILALMQAGAGPRPALATLRSESRV